MIKCPNCGKEAPDNAAFCTECGTKLKKAEAVQQQPQAQAQAQPQQQPQAQVQPQAQPQPQAQAQPQAQPQPQPQAQHLGAGAIPVLTLEGDPAPTVPPKPADPMSGGFKTAAPAADPGRSANTYAQNQGAYAQNPNVRPQNPPQAAQGAQAQNAQNAQNPNAYAQNQRTSAQNPNTYAQNPNTYAQNPNAYTPQYTAAPSTGAPDKKSPYAVLGIGGNMLNLFVIALPIIGFIVTLIWAFGGTNNLNRRNYACAVLIWWLIGIAAAIVLAILGVTVLAPFFSEILYYLSDFTGMY